MTLINNSESGASVRSKLNDLIISEARELKDPTTLLADTTLTYTAGQDGTVEAGDIVRTRAEGFSYEVAASGATDQHVTTAGGVKMYVLPSDSGRYPAPAFGSDGAALKKAWQVAGAVGVDLCGATYTVGSLTDTSASIHIYGPGTIAHQAAASGDAITNTGGSMKIEGVIIDGNRSNQSGRHSMLRQIGGQFEARNCHFTKTVYSAIRIGGTCDNVIIESNKFDDMAEHGGSLGEVSHAAYIVATTVDSLRVVFNDVRHGTPSAAGYSPAGFFISVSDTCSVDGLYNYFENIGQNVAGNFSGCFDFYTNAHAGTIVGNRAVNSYWVPFKLQIGDRQCVHSNRVEGLDSTAGAGMAFLQNTRSYAAVLEYAAVGSNFIDCGAGVNLPAVLLLGSDAYHSQGIILRDFIVPRCGIFVGAERFHQVEILNPIVDLPIGRAISIEDTDQGAGAPTTARYVVKGGRINSSVADAVYARTNVTNLDLTVEGVLFSGTHDPQVTMRGGKALRFNRNDFATGGIVQLDAQTIDEVEVYGNRGPAGSFGFASIGDLDFGYNPAWELSGKATYDPPSIASGSSASTTVTVTGASFSLHNAVAKFSQNLQGIELEAYVSGTDTVTVFFHNRSGSTRDLASGTLSVQVTRRVPYVY